MYKILLNLIFLSSVYAVNIEYTNLKDETSTINITRDHNKVCKEIKATPNIVWSGSFTNNTIPKECKKTFITTVGKITPISFHKEVKTIGELELIDFMKDAQGDENMLVIDTRLTKWYKLRTIPTAINIPFNLINEDQYEFEDILKTLGVKILEDTYDFTNAKSLALIDNASWCMQSTWAMQNLVKLGYPKSKIYWYRAGLTGWTMLNLTTTIPN